MIPATIQEAFDALVLAVRRDFIDRFNAYVPNTARATSPVKRGPGRPPGKARYVGTIDTAMGSKRRTMKTRKKPPIQLCPVPGCMGRGAPVYGMVCAAHKGVAKSKIKKYRDARRAAKANRS